MKTKIGILCIFLLIMLVPLAFAADSSSSSSTSSSSSSSSGSTTEVDNAALVYVSNVTLDPEVFYPGDTGTITVTLANGGTSAIGVSHPDIMSSRLTVDDEDQWETTSYIGAGSTMTFSLDVTAKPPDGTYYALFSIGTKSGNSVHYPIKVEVDSNPVIAAVTDKPTYFSPEAEQNVTLTIMNTRNGGIDNVVITPEGTGIDAYPSTQLVPTINASSSEDITFGIMPHQASNLTFHVSYQNGPNTHTTDVVLPISFGYDKTAAVPVVNNVELTSSGSTYEITGDVANAGISDAKGVIVTVGSPAKATGTYPEYAIGSIASDDSGSFDVTFTTNDLSVVPLVVSWKDENGNDYNLTKTLDLSRSASAIVAAEGTNTGTGSTIRSAPTGSQGQFGGGYPGGTSRSGYSQRSTPSIFSGNGKGLSAFYLPIAAGLIAVLCIVLYVKRKWILAKIRKKQ